MMLLKPVEHVSAKLLHKFHNLRSILFSGNAGHFVLSGITLCPASLKVISVVFSFIAQNQRQRGNCTVVLQGLLRSVARHMEQYGAELQRSIVGNAETPVSGYLTFRID